MNRRNFIKIMGGGVVLAAGGATAFAATRTPAAALAPWSQAGSFGDPRINALSHAILAPNPHNRQPWIVDLNGEDALTLYFDTDKQLPHTDPFDRQLTIGLGCFLELLRMAANADGFGVDITLFPEGEATEGLDGRPIAHARFFEAAPVIDPLFAHVMARRSNKEPYDVSREVAPDAVSRIVSVGQHTQIGGSVAPADIAFWRQLTTDALVIEIDTPHTYRESVDLMRIGKAEVNANPDGIDFSGPLFEALGLTGVMTRETLLNRESTVFQQGLGAVLANSETAMGHLWMVTRGNSRRDQIGAGADWLRVNLACTAEGLGFQPLSQALQEYPEMAAHYDTVHTRLAPEGGTVQMLARIGYGPEVPVSPRWPVDAKIRTV